MHPALNLTRFDNRVKLLADGGYSKNVNCAGIVPYLYGLQDHPIYLDFEELPAFLRRHFKPTTIDKLRKGDLILFSEEGQDGEPLYEHVAVFIANDGGKNTLFEKQGLGGGCVFAVLDPPDEETVSFFTPTIPPIPDEQDRFYICPDHPIGDKIRRVTAICQSYQDRLAREGIEFDHDHIDPDHYVETLSAEEAEECYSYQIGINRFLFAVALSKLPKFQSLDIAGVMNSLGLIWSDHRVDEFADRHNI